MNYLVDFINNIRYIKLKLFSISNIPTHNNTKYYGLHFGPEFGIRTSQVEYAFGFSGTPPITKSAGKIRGQEIYDLEWQNKYQALWKLNGISCGCWDDKEFEEFRLYGAHNFYFSVSYTTLVSESIDTQRLRYALGRLIANKIFPKDEKGHTLTINKDDSVTIHKAFSVDLKETLGQDASQLAQLKGLRTLRGADNVAQKFVDDTKAKVKSYLDSEVKKVVDEQFQSSVKKVDVYATDLLAETNNLLARQVDHLKDGLNPDIRTYTPTQKQILLERFAEAGIHSNVRGMINYALNQDINRFDHPSMTDDDKNKFQHLISPGLRTPTASEKQNRIKLFTALTYQTLLLKQISASGSHATSGDSALLRVIDSTDYANHEVFKLTQTHSRVPLLDILWTNLDQKTELIDLLVYALICEYMEGVKLHKNFFKLTKKKSLKKIFTAEELEKLLKCDYHMYTPDSLSLLENEDWVSPTGAASNFVTTTSSSTFTEEELVQSLNIYLTWKIMKDSSIGKVLYTESSHPLKLFKLLGGLHTPEIATEDGHHRIIDLQEDVIYTVPVETKPLIRAILVPDLCLKNVYNFDSDTLQLYNPASLTKSAIVDQRGDIYANKLRSLSYAHWINASLNTLEPDNYNCISTYKNNLSKILSLYNIILSKKKQDNWADDGHEMKEMETFIALIRPTAILQVTKCIDSLDLITKFIKGTLTSEEDKLFMDLCNYLYSLAYYEQEVFGKNTDVVKNISKYWHSKFIQHRFFQVKYSKRNYTEEAQFNKDEIEYSKIADLKDGVFEFDMKINEDLYNTPEEVRKIEKLIYLTYLLIHGELLDASFVLKNSDDSVYEDILHTPIDNFAQFWNKTQLNVPIIITRTDYKDVLRYKRGYKTDTSLHNANSVMTLKHLLYFERAPKTEIKLEQTITESARDTLNAGVDTLTGLWRGTQAREERQARRGDASTRRTALREGLDRLRAAGEAITGGTMTEYLRLGANMAAEATGLGEPIPTIVGATVDAIADKKESETTPEESTTFSQEEKHTIQWIQYIVSDEPQHNDTQRGIEILPDDQWILSDSNTQEDPLWMSISDKLNELHKDTYGIMDKILGMSASTRTVGAIADHALSSGEKQQFCEDLVATSLDWLYSRSAKRTSWWQMDPDVFPHQMALTDTAHSYINPNDFLNVLHFYNDWLSLAKTIKDEDQFRMFMTEADVLYGSEKEAWMSTVCPNREKAHIIGTLNTIQSLLNTITFKYLRKSDVFQYKIGMNALLSKDLIKEELTIVVYGNDNISFDEHTKVVKCFVDWITKHRGDVCTKKPWYINMNLFNMIRDYLIEEENKASEAAPTPQLEENTNAENQVGTVLGEAEAEPTLILDPHTIRAMNIMFGTSTHDDDQFIDLQLVKIMKENPDAFPAVVNPDSIYVFSTNSKTSPFKCRKEMHVLWDNVCAQTLSEVIFNISYMERINVTALETFKTRIMTQLETILGKELFEKYKQMMDFHTLIPLLHQFSRMILHHESNSVPFADICTRLLFEMVSFESQELRVLILKNIDNDSLLTFGSYLYPELANTYTESIIASSAQAYNLRKIINQTYFITKEGSKNVFLNTLKSLLEIKSWADSRARITNSVKVAESINFNIIPMPLFAMNHPSIKSPITGLSGSRSAAAIVDPEEIEEFLPQDTTVNVSEIQGLKERNITARSHTTILSALYATVEHMRRFVPNNISSDDDKYLQEIIDFAESLPTFHMEPSWYHVSRLGDDTNYQARNTTLRKVYERINAPLYGIMSAARMEGHPIWYMLKLVVEDYTMAYILNTSADLPNPIDPRLMKTHHKPSDFLITACSYIFDRLEIIHGGGADKAQGYAYRGLSYTVKNAIPSATLFEKAPLAEAPLADRTSKFDTKIQGVKDDGQEFDIDDFIKAKRDHLYNTKHAIQANAGDEIIDLYIPITPIPQDFTGTGYRGATQNIYASDRTDLTSLDQETANKTYDLLHQEYHELMMTEKFSTIKDDIVPLLELSNSGTEDLREKLKEYMDNLIYGIAYLEAMPVHRLYTEDLEDEELLMACQEYINVLIHAKILLKTVWENLDHEFHDLKSNRCDYLEPFIAHLNQEYLLIHHLVHRTITRRRNQEPRIYELPTDPNSQQSQVDAAQYMSGQDFGRVSYTTRQTNQYLIENEAPGEDGEVRDVERKLESYVKDEPIIHAARITNTMPLKIRDFYIIDDEVYEYTNVHKSHDKEKKKDNTFAINTNRPSDTNPDGTLVTNLVEQLKDKGQANKDVVLDRCDKNITECWIRKNPNVKEKADKSYTKDDFDQLLQQSNDSIINTYGNFVDTICAEIDAPESFVQDVTLDPIKSRRGNDHFNQTVIKNQLKDLIGSGGKEISDELDLYKRASKEVDGLPINDKTRLAFFDAINDLDMRDMVNRVVRGHNNSTRFPLGDPNNPIPLSDITARLNMLERVVILLDDPTLRNEFDKQTASWDDNTDVALKNRAIHNFISMANDRLRLRISTTLIDKINDVTAVNDEEKWNTTFENEEAINECWELFTKSGNDSWWEKTNEICDILSHLYLVESHTHHCVTFWTANLPKFYEAKDRLDALQARINIYRDEVLNILAELISHQRTIDGLNDVFANVKTGSTKIYDRGKLVYDKTDLQETIMTNIKTICDEPDEQLEKIKQDYLNYVENSTEEERETLEHLDRNKEIRDAFRNYLQKKHNSIMIMIMTKNIKDAVDRLIASIKLDTTFEQMFRRASDNHHFELRVDDEGKIGEMVIPQQLKHRIIKRRIIEQMNEAIIKKSGNFHVDLSGAGTTTTNHPNAYIITRPAKLIQGADKTITAIECYDSLKDTSQTNQDEGSYTGLFKTAGYTPGQQQSIKMYVILRTIFGLGDGDYDHLYDDRQKDMHTAIMHIMDSLPQDMHVTEKQCGPFINAFKKHYHNSEFSDEYPDAQRDVDNMGFSISFRNDLFRALGFADDILEANDENVRAFVSASVAFANEIKTALPLLKRQVTISTHDLEVPSDMESTRNTERYKHPNTHVVRNIHNLKDLRNKGNETVTRLMKEQGALNNNTELCKELRHSVLQNYFLKKTEYDNLVNQLSATEQKALKLHPSTTDMAHIALVDPLGFKSLIGIKQTDSIEQQIKTKLEDRATESWFFVIQRILKEYYQGDKKASFEEGMQKINYIYIALNWILPKMMSSSNELKLEVFNKPASFDSMINTLSRQFDNSNAYFALDAVRADAAMRISEGDVLQKGVTKRKVNTMTELMQAMASIEPQSLNVLWRMLKIFGEARQHTFMGMLGFSTSSDLFEDVHSFVTDHKVATGIGGTLRTMVDGTVNSGLDIQSILSAVSTVPGLEMIPNATSKSVLGFTVPMSTIVSTTGAMMYLAAQNDNKYIVRGRINLEIDKPSQHIIADHLNILYGRVLTGGFTYEYDVMMIPKLEVTTGNLAFFNLLSYMFWFRISCETEIMKLSYLHVIPTVVWELSAGIGVQVNTCELVDNDPMLIINDKIVPMDWIVT